MIGDWYFFSGKDLRRIIYKRSRVITLPVEAYGLHKERFGGFGDKGLLVALHSGITFGRMGTIWNVGD